MAVEPISLLSTPCCAIKMAWFIEDTTMWLMLMSGDICVDVQLIIVGGAVGAHQFGGGVVPVDAGDGGRIVALFVAVLVVVGPVAE